MARVYVERLDSGGFVIAAGNRAITYWKMQLELTGDNPVRGTFSAIETDNPYQWGGNVLAMVAVLESAIGLVGGSEGKWPR